MKILTLWDIDGTLVNVNKYHTPAYQKAIEAVYGVKLSFCEIEKNYGLPTREVIAIPLRKRGIREEIIQKKILSVFSIYSKELEEGLRNASNKSELLLPGVLSLLEKIGSQKIPMGIVTGNIKKAGEAILKGLSLDHCFNPILNSYGDTAITKSEIVLNAINSAKENNIIDDNTRIFVFGDSPAEIDAARSNNCISLAVIKDSNDLESSPGGSRYIRRKKILMRSRPDYLLDDYTDLEKILSILT